LNPEGDMHAASTEADSIERISTPDAVLFKTRYFDARKPVVIVGGAKDWPASSKWNKARLASLDERTPIPVDVYEDGDFFAIGGAIGHRKRVRMSFRKYVEAAAGASRTRYYAPDLSLRRYFPELERDVCAPPFLPPGALPRFFLFAGENAITAGHFHPFTHALTCQVVGRKRIVVYSPEDGEGLYPFPWFSPAFHWSRVNFLEPDYARFPKLQSTRPLVAELEPGDALFIPAHFWHWTRGVDFSVSVLVSWKADLGAWHFPAPGFACAFAKVVWPVEDAIRKLASGAKNAGTRLFERA
jgi:hypothetical protein